jgi:hypothetical protein
MRLGDGFGLLRHGENCGVEAHRLVMLYLFKRLLY